MFRRDCWGQGFATEAARALLADGFGRYGLSQVTASTFVGNAASEHVLTKLGFRKTGTGMGTCRAQNCALPVTDWLLDYDDFLTHDPILLRTARCRLRNLVPDDAADLRVIVTTPSVGRMLVIYPPDWTHEQAKQHVAENQYNGQLRFRVGIEHDNRLIGAIGAGDGDEPSIFYYFDPQVHGQGLASEVVSAFVEAVFARFPVSTIKAGVFQDNPASARVLERCGFLRTGEGFWKSAARLEEAPLWHYRRERSA